MKNTRILAYEVSKKLDEQDLENIAAAANFSIIGPSVVIGKSLDIGTPLDL